MNRRFAVFSLINDILVIMVVGNMFYSAEKLGGKREAQATTS